MTKAEIEAGICGFKTTVTAKMDGGECEVSIEGGCEAIRRMAEQICRLDPFREMTYRGDGPLVLSVAPQHLPHPSCPVPSGILKAVEVEAGLALPAPASIQVRQDV